MDVLSVIMRMKSKNTYFFHCDFARAMWFASPLQPKKHGYAWRPTYPVSDTQETRYAEDTPRYARDTY
ncbi:unnamed protein product [Prunus armeniaca]